MTSSNKTDHALTSQWKTFEPKTMTDQNKEAYQLGFNAGVIKTKEELSATFNDHEKQFNEAKLSLLNEQNKLLKDLTDRISLKQMHFASELQASCLKIIQHILSIEISSNQSNEEQLKKILAELINEAIPNIPGIIYINADSYTLVKNMSLPDSLSFKIDEHLNQGDFYIKQGDSYIDGRIDSRIQCALDTILSE